MSGEMLKAKSHATKSCPKRFKLPKKAKQKRICAKQQWKMRKSAGVDFPRRSGKEEVMQVDAD